MPIYLQYGEIRGSVTAAGYKGWVELLSYAVGMGPTIVSVDSSRHEVYASKYPDGASASLLEAFLHRESKKAVIVYLMEDGGKAVLLHRLELEDTRIDAFEQHAHGDDSHAGPMELLGLSFAKLRNTPGLSQHGLPTAGKAASAPAKVK